MDIIIYHAILCKIFIMVFAQYCVDSNPHGFPPDPEPTLMVYKMLGNIQGLVNYRSLILTGAWFYVGYCGSVAI
ncbi:MAG: hypothetical protein JXA66_02770 [Oligoflexia bacterium]|nr:hypothetical protein [Oligoflexia bacterium]